jgi:hypothetical protein
MRAIFFLFMEALAAQSEADEKAAAMRRKA